MAVDFETLKHRLAEADAHIHRGAGRVAKQRALVEGLEQNGCDASEARELLARFEEAQAIYLADRDWIAAQLPTAEAQNHSRQQAE